MPQKERHTGIAGSDLQGRGPSRSARVEVHLFLPAADHRIYAAAARRLRRSMGANAPDIETLIQHELSDRDVGMIVADYLETTARRAARAKAARRQPTVVGTRAIPAAPYRRSRGRGGPTSPDPGIAPRHG